MPEQQVYICDKIEDIYVGEKAKQPIPCRKSVGDEPVMISLSFEVNGVSEPTINHQFCSVAHANFWLKRQRLD